MTAERDVDGDGELCALLSEKSAKPDEVLFDDSDASICSEDGNGL